MTLLGVRHNKWAIRNFSYSLTTGSRVVLYVIKVRLKKRLLPGVFP